MIMEERYVERYVCHSMELITDPGGGGDKRYSGVKRMGMTVGNPRKLP